MCNAAIHHTIYTEGVTFSDFTRLAKKHECTPEAVMTLMRPTWEGHDPLASFVKRLFTPSYGHVVIPYRPLLKLYLEWACAKQEQKDKVCACGCGKSLKSSFRRFASRECQKRGAAKTGQ